jgi:hypothetical protein
MPYAVIAPALFTISGSGLAVRGSRHSLRFLRIIVA